MKHKLLVPLKYLMDTVAPLVAAVVAGLAARLPAGDPSGARSGAHAKHNIIHTQLSARADGLPEQQQQQGTN